MPLRLYQLLESRRDLYSAVAAVDICIYYTTDSELKILIIRGGELPIIHMK
jgi:hypothetical protein